MTRSQHDFDVAIIGASLAGAYCSATLNYSDRFRIALIDKEHFPRRKPCGEGLSQAAARMLNRVKVDVPALGAHPFKGYRVIGSERSISLLNKSGEEPIGWGVERRVLDTALLEAALRGADIEPMLGVRNVRIASRRSGVEVQAGARRFTAKVLVAADGAHSSIARQLGIPIRRSGDARSGATVLCRTDRTGSEVEIYPGAGYEMYVTPLGGELLNVSVLGKRDAVRSALREVFRCDPGSRALSALAKVLNRPLEQVEPVAGVGSAFPSSRLPVLGPVFLAGDSAECLDPISGMGMTQAIRSGKLLGETLSPLLRGEADLECVSGKYEHELERSVRPLRGYTRLAYLLLGVLQSTRVLSAAHRTGLPEMLREAALRDLADRSGHRGHRLSKALLRIVGAGAPC